MAAKLAFRALPPAVHFSDVLEGSKYSTRVHLQNIGNVAKRVFLNGAQAQSFSVQVEGVPLEQYMIAPGMGIDVVVSYDCNSRSNVFERFVLASIEGEVLEVTLRATVPSPDVVCEPSLDFGRIVADGRIATKHIDVTNRGSLPTRFVVKSSCNLGTLVIKPTSGQLDARGSARSTQRLTVEYSSQTPGQLECDAVIEVESQAVAPQFPITALAVEHSLKFLTANSQLLSGNFIDIGCSYFGTRRVVRAIFLNDGPVPINFVIVPTTLKAWTHTPTGRDPVDISSSPISIEPNQGALEPYGKVTLDISFEPTMPAKRTGWTHENGACPRLDVDLVMLATAVGTSRALELAISASAVPAMMVVSASKLEFSECDVGEKETLSFSISNASTLLPLPVAMPKVPNFVISPQTALILPSQSASFDVTFAPRQIGTFNKKVLISAVDSTVEHPLVLRCSCNSDPAYSRSDAQVDSDNPAMTLSRTQRRVNDTKGAPQTAFKLGMSNVTSSKTLGFSLPDGRQHLGLHATVGRTQGQRTLKPSPDFYKGLDPTYAFTDEELSARNAEKDKYAQLIVNLAETRKANEFKQRELDARKFLNDIDIGLQPGSRLKSPEPNQAVPSTHARTLAVLPATGQKVSSPAAPSPHAFAASALATKTASATSATKATSTGKRQTGTSRTRVAVSAPPGCEPSIFAQSLSPLELYNVVLNSERCIDFGEVCEDSSNSRSLEFHNNLERPVQIAFKSDCKELASVSNVTQILPANGTASFNVVLDNITSDTPRVFHRGLQYIINGQHSFDLFVDAKVVPIALHVSSQSIMLPVSIFPKVSTTVTLKNPYGNFARFSWTLESAYDAANLGETAEQGRAADAASLSVQTSRTVQSAQSVVTSASHRESLRQVDPEDWFSVTPRQGVVGPHETLACVVEYTPGFNALGKVLLKLNVEGNNALQQTIACRADYGHPKCVFADKRILLGTIASQTTATAYVSVSNNSHKDAFFEVSDLNAHPGKAFVSVEPMQGRIRARGNVQLRVTYNTAHVGKFEGEFQVKVKGMSEVGKYFITGQAEVAKVEMQPSQFNVGRVNRGALCRVPFTITNLRKSVAKVVIDLSLFEDWSVVLPRDEINGLEERVAPLVASEADSVESIEDGIAQLQVQSTSTTSLETISRTDLAKRLSRLRSLRALVDQIKQMRSFFDNGEFEAGSEETYLQEIQRLEVQAINLQRLLGLPALQLSSKGLKHEIVVGPQATIHAYLDLLPIQVAAYDFKIPVQLNGLASDIDVRVTATVIRAPLDISTRKVDFGRVFLSQSTTTGAANIPAFITPHQTKIITFACQDNQQLDFHLDLTEASSLKDIFVLSADKAFPDQQLDKRVSIKPGQLYNLTVDFNPKVEGWFECSIPVHLHDGASGVYAKIELRGWGTLPYLAFSDSTIVLPVVPVGISSHATVLLRGFGYTDAAASVPISCRLPAFLENSPISVDFPDGMVLTRTPVRDDYRESVDSIGSRPNSADGTQSNAADAVLSVRIHCLASKSVSFRYQIHFVDGYGRKFPLNVVGNIDSCLLSLYPHIASHRNAYYVAACPDISPAAYHEHMTQYVSRWFSLFGLPNRKPIDIPESLLENFGSTFFDIVKYLSGKDATGLPLVRPANVKPGAVQDMFRMALDYLKTNGACLSHIQPEQLLSPADFQHYKRVELLQLKETGTLSLSIGIRRRREIEDLERNLFSISQRAWTTVLAQTWRVFVLSRVSPSGMRALMERRRESTNDASSLDAVHLTTDSEYEDLFSAASIHGIHSSKEAMLLFWLSFVHKDISHTAVDVENFGDDLADGCVLASVLTFYVPPLAETYFADLFPHPQDVDHRRHNVLRVMSACQSIGIPFALQLHDILEPNPCFMLMFCVHLYELLPQYLPQSKAIVFSGQLQAKIVRQVEITNPTKTPLTYRAIVSGCQDFQVQSSVTVAPNSTASLAATFVARFSRATHATLLLIGEATSAASGSVLAFSLHSDILLVSPLSAKPASSVFKCEPIPCYARTQLSVPVTNNYASSGKFTVRVFSLAGRPGQLSGSQAGQVNVGRSKQHRTTGAVSTAQGEGSTSGITFRLDELLSSTTRAEFWSDQREVTLASGKSASLALNFVPMFVGDHEAIVWLKDDEVGEIVLLVTGRARFPESSGTVRWNCDGNAGSLQKLHVPYENAQKIKALSQMPSQSRHDVSDALSKNVTLTVSQGRLISDAVLLGVEYRGSSCFTGPNSVKLIPARSSAKGTLFAPHLVASNLVELAEATDLEVTFSPVGFGDYECDIVLSGPDDIRSFHIIATVHDV